jgi:hypothetical protein
MAFRPCEAGEGLTPWSHLRLGYKNEGFKRAKEKDREPKSKIVFLGQRKETGDFFWRKRKKKRNSVI